MNLKITQVKSSIRQDLKKKKTLEALGLRKIRQEVIFPESPSVRGMIKVVSHLVKVEEN